MQHSLHISKGQIKPEADWHAIDSTKKQMKFQVQVSSISGQQSKKRQIGLFSFWENLRRANLLTVLSDL